MINKALKLFLIIDIGVVLFCILSDRNDWLLNTQIAFFSSLFVTLGSYLGYKKNIEKRVEYHTNDDDNYDEIDKMDDKYDLYSPQIEQTAPSEPTKEQIKQIIKENKPKGNHLKNFIGGFSGMASLYRLFGYLGLIVGFFYLNNNGYLHTISYLVGFMIVPFSAILFALVLKNDPSMQQDPKKI
ncbi:MAG: hypothetical protein IE909_04985 [Campylobacterales bacterium]|nr:hypothetical protein [Campylobacterales bacterium]